MTVGMTKADDDVTTQDGVNSFYKEFTYRTDTKAGLQFDYQLNDNWSATIQLSGKAREDWDLGAEWAFLSWKTQDWLTVRGGRLRIPLFMYSETLDVSYTYPWSRPPIGFYITSVANYEGFDALITFETGPVSHQLQPYVGASEGTLPNGLDARGTDIYGLAYESYWQDFVLRLSGVKLNLEVSGDKIPAGLLDTESVSFYSAGLKYDDGNFLVLSEYSRIDGSGLPSRDLETSYITLAYTVGKWQPYYSFMALNTLHESDIDPGLVITKFAAPIQAKSSTLGIRYDLTSNIAVKIQGEHFYDFDGTGGVWQGTAPPPGSFAQVFPDEADIYSLTVDAVF